MQEKIIKEAKKYIEEAEAIIISSGAGMGVDSGLPDFRGNQGFWKEYPLLKNQQLSFIEMADPINFKINPRLAWAFYGHRLNLYRETVPHMGFELLKKLCTKKNDNYFIYTSNVDGQFQKAGFDVTKIYEIHGSIHHMQCQTPCAHDIWSANDIEISIDAETFTANEPFPLCPHCGEIARPNILMFNDWAWLNDRATQQNERLNQWLDKNSNKKMVIFEMGAGRAIPSVRMFSRRMCHSQQNHLIRINPRDYEVHKGQIAIPLGSLDALKLLLE